ncbi:uncharacterized protein LOC142047615 [Chelonoidis abingdonii]|uniref:uncharacterized protein LOC142047615 n=1 Tax=Chelonoidis abingdonii TaxID=106734 RepID=UPI003F497681
MNAHCEPIYPVSLRGGGHRVSPTVGRGYLDRQSCMVTHLPVQYHAPVRLSPDLEPERAQSSAGFPAQSLHRRLVTANPQAHLNRQADLERSRSGLCFAIHGRLTGGIPRIRLDVGLRGRPAHTQRNLIETTDEGPLLDPRYPTPSHARMTHGPSTCIPPSRCPVDPTGHLPLVIPPSPLPRLNPRAHLPVSTHPMPDRTHRPIYSGPRSARDRRASIGRGRPHVCRGGVGALLGSCSAGGRPARAMALPPPGLAGGAERRKRGVVTHRWMAQHNQTGGIHTLQLHVNCVLDGDTPVRGQFHFAFDGQDFLILERNQSAWVPLAPEASNEMHFWDAGHTWTLFAREFLQEECVDTLRSLLRGGMEALGRQVPPGISVTYRDTPQGAATLCCHARGFYPRPIRVSWVRDGAQILPPMDASRFLPHADSTYQIRQSLEIPQRWGHSYACQVVHSSLGEPVPNMALPEVSVSRRDSPDGSVSLSCHARGFDPRPIRVSWVRDGKETLAPLIGDVSQLQRSVGIPQQAGAGHSYSCHVQPHSLQEMLVTPAPGEMGGPAPGILAALGLAVLTGSGAVLAGVVVWRRKRSDSGRGSFAPTAGEDPTPDLDPAGLRQSTPV